MALPKELLKAIQGIEPGPTRTLVLCLVMGIIFVTGVAVKSELRNSESDRKMMEVVNASNQEKDRLLERSEQRTRDCEEKINKEKDHQIAKYELKEASRLTLDSIDRILKNRKR